MNRYVRMMIEIPLGILKAITTNILCSKAHMSYKCAISPLAEVTIESKAIVNIGSKFRIRGGSHIRVRDSAKLTIGQDVAINNNCMIVCRDSIEIGEGTEFGPGIMVYDHDHDYRTGLKNKMFKTAPIKIGKNCWIGANVIILRGTVLEDNCVVAAGCILKGEFKKDSCIIQKRETRIC